MSGTNDASNTSDASLEASSDLSAGDSVRLCIAAGQSFSYSPIVCGTAAPPSSPSAGPAPTPQTPSPLALPAPALASQDAPPPERLAALLICTTPLVFSFGGAQSSAERAELMATVPPDVQRVAKMIMTDEILHYYDCHDSPERPLQYYMSTTDEYEEIIAAGTEEIRGHSPDWRLAYYERDTMCFCDFNGWPGDNQSGAGYFWWRGHPGDGTVIYRNGDESLTALRPEYARLVAAFQAIRMGDSDGESD